MAVFNFGSAAAHDQNSRSVWKIAVQIGTSELVVHILTNKFTFLNWLTLFGYLFIATLLIMSFSNIEDSFTEESTKNYTICFNFSQCLFKLFFTMLTHKLTTGILLNINRKVDTVVARNNHQNFILINITNNNGVLIDLHVDMIMVKFSQRRQFFLVINELRKITTNSLIMTNLSIHSIKIRILCI